MDERGFTLVEIMVAALVLIVGMLGVLTMLTGGLSRTAANNERIGATNLARDLVESARGMDYDDLTTALVPARLQARGLGAGTPWTISRRGVTYTVTPTVCTYDDPADKRGAAPTAAESCSTLTAPAGETSPDRNPDDFRRVTFNVAWREDGGASRSMNQTSLIVNPTGGLGPRITNINPLTQTITCTPPPSAPPAPHPSCATAVNNIVFTTTLAASLHWEIDDGTSTGDLASPTSAGATSFNPQWSIGQSNTGTEILDGTYQIAGQAFDYRDIAGEAKRGSIVLNRRAPYAPPSLRGGHDTRVSDWVDLDWGLNSERDVLGYRVYWEGPDNTVGNGNDQRVCPAPAAGATAVLSSTTTRCADFGPTAAATKYYVVAVDRDAANALREGDLRELPVAAAGARPAAPTALSVTTNANGVPALSWTAPATGSPSFYRVYRDGSAVGYADRYDRTIAAQTTFIDSAPGTVSHQYWVTAVDSAYNESDPLGPQTWTP